VHQEAGAELRKHKTSFPFAESTDYRPYQVNTVKPPILQIRWKYFKNCYDLITFLSKLVPLKLSELF
jgi:hypothetical protein